MSELEAILLEDTPYFEERADYLDRDQLIEWTVKGKHFDRVQKKLIGTGAKLIVGPRGTGKTHMMRCAFYACVNDESRPLPIYVSFNRYLRLETFLNKASNALDIFHAWVLSKIIYECSEQYGSFVENAPFSKSDLRAFIEEVERQIDSPKHSPILSFVSIDLVKEYLIEAARGNGRSRVILLLDDAALTLTHDYMVEFFDIFRSLKSTLISPKASVYPGTTQYGPRFHVGHDAEQVPVWVNVDDADYSQFMDDLLSRRLREVASIDENILEILKYASFGVPRAFLMMLRDYIEFGGGTPQSKFNHALQQRKSAVLEEYRSIGQKVPQYKNIIEVGERFFLNIVEDLKKHNHSNMNKEGYKKTISVGLTDIPSKAKRMIRFLVEAGLMYELPEVSHGVDRQLSRYIPHLAILLESKVFTKQRGFNAANLASVLNGKSDKHPLRRSFNSILTEAEVENISLVLPPCSICNAPRISEKQKFCHNCGSPLIDISAFDSCMKKPLQEIPLTTFQKHAIETYTYFKTVEDVLTCQDPASELKKADGIGPNYAERIFRKVNEWVDEFLV